MKKIVPVLLGVLLGVGFWVCIGCATCGTEECPAARQTITQASEKTTQAANTQEQDTPACAEWKAKIRAARNYLYDLEAHNPCQESFR